MKHFAKILCLGAALIAAPLLAHATPITGTIGFAGNGSYSAATKTFTAGGPIGGSIPTNGYVFNAGTGSLSGFAMFNPATFYTFNASTFASGGNLVFTSTSGATLTFKLTSMLTNTASAAGDSFTGMGVLTLTGGSTTYDPTVASFSLGTNSNGTSFVTFNTATAAQTPEPSSLVLLGSGLLSAAGMVARRRRV